MAAEISGCFVVGTQRHRPAKTCSFRVRSLQREKTIIKVTKNMWLPQAIDSCIVCFEVKVYEHDDDDDDDDDHHHDDETLDFGSDMRK